MKVRPLSIDGAWEFTPVQHGDARGLFAEVFKGDLLSEVVGHRLDLAQVNLSVSAAGRGSAGIGTLVYSSEAIH